MMWLFVLVCLNTAATFAQLKVNGTVTDSKKEPLIGVNIKVVGTKTGTITIGNNDGTKPSLGTATYDVNSFLTKIAYSADAATGLTQILTQKYVLQQKVQNIAKKLLL